MRPDLLPLLAGDVSSSARSVRDLKAADLEGIPPEFMRRSARLLRMASYSAWYSARRLEARARLEEQR
jgi:hypothetical protein